MKIRSGSWGLLSLFSILLATSSQFCHAQGYAPDKAVERMTVADGLQVKVFASEPEIRQPIFVKCDDRGRPWTIQYLQYPNPAGLDRVKVDRWSRTVYDRVPEPPPHGPRGADRITILEDTDGDGQADKVKDFVDGLNLVTGVAFGHGGVFVLNVPYLLFYPDRNRDDVPDSDPEVLLTGFGMEDAQSMSNHLTWGPDGWLYGVNGSTTTCQIRDLEFQQGLWRYHPLSHKFELFCEGGSNCYGVTFDANGELYYSTNGGPFVHAVQGGYYFKSFGKHGPLHNLHAYHYFPNLKCDQVPGGPPTGGTIYQGGAFPEAYNGKFMAGNFLGHTLSWWSIEPQGSTVSAKFGAAILNAHDTWFGPTDVCLGPDGALYVSDFYDQRTAHPDPDANWDLDNGRIYKIEATHREVLEPFDLVKLSSDELVDLLSHRNHWFRDRARVEMAQRRDSSIVERLREMASQTNDPQLALQGLWAHYVTAGLDESLALQLLDHPDPYVRFWIVRLLGDEGEVARLPAEKLIWLAKHETSPVVRAQLAASAKRIVDLTGLEIVKQLLKSHPDESDERISWLIWWAIEAKALTDTDALVEMVSTGDTWQNPAARENGLRLIRRYAAEGTTFGYGACLQILQLAVADHQPAALEQLNLGLAERAVDLHGLGQGSLFEQQAAVESLSSAESRHFEPLPEELKTYIAGFWRERPTNLLALELALRADIDQATGALVEQTRSAGTDLQQLTPLLDLLDEFSTDDAAPTVIEQLATAQTDDIKHALLNALANWGSSDVTQAILSEYTKASPSIRSQIRDILLARPQTAMQLLQLVDAGTLDAEQIPVEQLQRLAVHNNEGINALVRKHWGNIGPGTSEEKLATMRRLSNDLRATAGDPVLGKELFAKHCGICHQLHGEGNRIGPDLTTANRKDRAAMLSNVVDPSAVIRREYINTMVATTSGRIISGLLAEQDAASLTLLDAQNNRIKFVRDEIEELRESEVSLMPEKLLESLSPQQLRDLFSYLEL
ncbi:MAG: c-type cytochrome [Anaerolineae bacterium]|nr:c-type cytochrome [Anaerolineae bacterium]